MEKEKAVVLLSGGLDSCTCMAVAKSKGYDVYPISFNYHQRHSIELEGAKKIAAYYGVKKHLIIETNMEAIGGSALTDEKIEVPEGDVNRHSVPPTYVPARNLIFLSYAMGYAEARCDARLHRRQLRRLLGLPGLPPGVHPEVPGARQLRDDSDGRRGQEDHD